MAWSGLPTDLQRTMAWSGLPADLVISIAERLPVPDLFRFSAVCKSWTLVTKDLHLISSRHRRRCFPWLVLSPDSVNTEHLSLFNPSENRCYHLPVPSHFTFPFGIASHKDGWIVSYDNNLKIPIIFNPITAAQLPLPSFSAFPISRCNERLTAIVLAAAVPPLPMVAFASCCNLFNNGLAFAVPGDDRWSHIHSSVADVCGGFLIGVVSHGGRFYALYSNGQLLSFGLTGSSPPQVDMLARNESNPIHVDRRNIRLVSTPSGELLQLQVRLPMYYSSSRIYESFLILKFDHETDCWVEMTDLGDHSLFVNFDLCGVAVLSSRDVRGLRRNCIYFTDEDIHSDAYRKKHSHIREEEVFHAGVYDLEKARVEPCFSSNVPSCGRHLLPMTWFMPSLS